MQTTQPNRRTPLLLAGLVLATLLAYLPVWNAQFLTVDDHAYVTENPVVQQGLTANSIRWAFDGEHVANYHPLTWLSHELDCELFGLNPRWHHAENLLLHIGNVVLLFLILRSFTGREIAAAFVAGVFAIHPLQVESVAWVAERKNVLSSFFWMLTLAGYGWYVARGGWGRYTLALLTFALGLLAKPIVVTMPCVLLLLDLWPLGRTCWFQPARQNTAWQSRARKLHFLILEKLPFLGLSVASCIATIAAQAKGGAVASTEQMGIGFRLSNAIVSYVRYLWSFLAPANLSAFYPLLRPWSIACVVAAVVLLVAITLVILFLSRRRPYLGFGWLWFLGVMVPMAGIVQVGNQAMADRYMYLPLIGLAIMVTWLAGESLPRLGTRNATFAAAAILLTFTGITVHDSYDWQNSERLFTVAIARTEPNVFALHNLGSALMLRGQTEQAIATFEQCAKLQPSNPHVRRALGYALREAGRFDDAKKQLAMSIHLDPREPRTWNTMGHVYADQNNWQAAADHFAVAAELKSDDFDSRINMAIAHRQLGQPAAAEQDLHEALAINPGLGKPWYLLGRLMLELHRPADAVEPLTKAIRLEPTNGDAFFQLGVALMQSGHGDRATAPLLKAAELLPNSPEPLTQLAWVLATHPDDKLRRGSDALFLASRANDLAKATSAETLDALAAALAEQQQFPEATKVAEQARLLAQHAGSKELAERVADHLLQLQRHQPLRDPSLAGAGLEDAIR